MIKIILLASLVSLLWIANTQTVEVEVFYESLCPFCHDFLKNQLIPVMKTELANYAQLRLYPYGNVQVLPDGTYNCQHGVNECDLNRLQACALHLHPSMASIDFVLCTTDSVDEAGTCAEKYFGPNALAGLLSCLNGPQGAHLMKLLRGHSERAHYKYVPWVTINGVHSEIAQKNLAFAICQALGQQAPSFCAANFYRLRKLAQIHNVFSERCYR